MTLLSVENLCAGYGPTAVLRDVSLDVKEGEIVCVLGANGAGKSTLLRAISRLIGVTSGTIRYKGINIVEWPPHRAAASGISHVPEGRGIFGNLTVDENLRLATFANRDKKRLASLFDEVFRMFPVLSERKVQRASTLSGGEQQMLAIGRAMIADGDLFVFDEPSMGLSPILVQSIFSIIREIRARGKTLLIVEQNAVMALAHSTKAYVLENGRIIAHGKSTDIANQAELRKAYLG